MNPIHEDAKLRFFHGDNCVVMATFAADAFDSMVTDPPSGIAFMGKEWDTDKGGRDQWIKWLATTMREAFRVLKPGAHALVWALPKTSHWTATAMEDAGFEIRDVIVHVFATGFPKSLNVSKAIDRAAGAKREKVRVAPRPESSGTMAGSSDTRPWIEASREHGYHEADGNQPVTEEAVKWNGWGTALKPASEHWILCRKPLAKKTVAANIIALGTGGLNIDGSRVATTDTIKPVFGGQKGEANGGKYGNSDAYQSEVSAFGRFPANLVLSHADGCVCSGVKKVSSSGKKDRQLECRNIPGVYGGGLNSYQQSPGFADADETETVESWVCVEGCPVKELDRQSGVTVTKQAGGTVTDQRDGSESIGAFEGSYMKPDRFDEGGASRFFFVAKPSRAERDHGIDEAPAGKRPNHHPTVKPISLMGYLIRMITPPGGTVLDPFSGSGTTARAALEQGFKAALIDMDLAYVNMAHARCTKVNLGLAL